uniref:Uncharacterized protein n=1 Tax=Hainan astro-like virus 2 TaxID=2116150 RepID=A0A2P1GNB4_9VIRU|nr:hypothetical protein [Hainan astro-like virus 2]
MASHVFQTSRLIPTDDGLDLMWDNSDLEVNLQAVLLPPRTPTGTNRPESPDYTTPVVVAAQPYHVLNGGQNADYVFTENYANDCLILTGNNVVEPIQFSNLQWGLLPNSFSLRSLYVTRPNNGPSYLNVIYRIPLVNHPPVQMERYTIFGSRLWGNPGNRRR